MLIISCNHNYSKALKKIMKPLCRNSAQFVLTFSNSPKGINHMWLTLKTTIIAKTVSKINCSKNNKILKIQRSATFITRNMSPHLTPNNIVNSNSRKTLKGFKILEKFKTYRSKCFHSKSFSLNQRRNAKFLNKKSCPFKVRSKNFGKI
jgi:hypothetical protein